MQHSSTFLMRMWVSITDDGHFVRKDPSQGVKIDRRCGMRFQHQMIQKYGQSSLTAQREGGVGRKRMFHKK